MNLKTKAWLFSWVICCAMAAAAAPPPETQPAPPSPLPAAKSPTPGADASATQPLRDPTQADPALRQALSGAQPNTVAVPRPLPQVTRRGLIVVAGKPTVALIEVQGSGIFFVREGTTLTVGGNGTSTILRVVRLSPDNMEIAVDSQNVTIIAH